MPRAREADWIVGVDIGGTNINVGVVPFEGGNPLAFRTEATEAQRGAKFVVDRVAKMIEESIDDVMKQENCTREAFAGVGIGSPGPLDRKTGTVINGVVQVGVKAEAQFVQYREPFPELCVTQQSLRKGAGAGYVRAGVEGGDVPNPPEPRRGG